MSSDHGCGVCSWSLQATSPEDLAARVQACGLTAVQLALDPIRTGSWDFDRTVRVLADAGIRVLSGMMEMAGEDYSSLASICATGGVRPDATWSANRDAAAANADIAARLGLNLVTFHAGFLPHDTDDPERATMLDRLRAIVGIFDARGVRVGFETGQEAAPTLLEVLRDLDRPTAGVNFDPANMILYDMGDPVASARALSGRIVQVHVKDAVRTREPGTWGAEVRVGTGDVVWREFFAALKDSGVSCDLVIEREAGDARVEDIRAAAEVVGSMWESRS